MDQQSGLQNSGHANGGAMAFFIRRPVLAFVLNALIVVAGLAALTGVDVRELPDIDRPTVTVVTKFSGASAETVDKKVTQNVEEAIARVSGVKKIASQSSFGRSNVVIEFNDGVDLNVASADIRDVLSRITNSLPSDADTPSIIKADSNADPVLRLSVTSKARSTADLTVFTENQIVDALSSVNGVANIQIFGDREKIFRIDVDQLKLASYGMTVADLSKALATMALDAPAGSLRTDNQMLVVRATANLSTTQAFENIYLNDTTRIGDVAKVTLGPDIETARVRFAGNTGIALGVIRQAQSNTLDISAGVRKVVDNLSKTLPDDIKLSVIADDSTFIQGALYEVETALVVAMLSVVVVIFLFLWDARATIIPALSIPVALVGTVAAIYLAGFSINILTLLALVLATGLVVDDAVVVLENIVRQRNMGMGTRAAAVLGTKEVFFAVIATTLTLCAVFIPLSFLPGQTGGLFREFGFVLAIAILLSAVVALSLCPMLASKFLKQNEKQQNALKRPQILATIGDKLGSFYQKTLHVCLNHPWLVVLAVVGFVVVSALSSTRLHQELTPPEDRAQVLLSVSGPQGISAEYLSKQIAQIEERIKPLYATGEVVDNFSIAGLGDAASNQGFVLLSLAPWGERSRSQQAITQDVKKAVADIVSVRVFALEGNSLGIRGGGQGLRFAIIGSADYSTLQPVAAKLIAAMQNDPNKSFVYPRLSVEPTQPQLFVTIDRQRASDLGVDITGLANAVQAMLDGRRMGSVYVADRSYDVKLVSRSQPMKDPEDLKNIFLKTAEGRFVSLSTIASVEEKPIPPQLAREERMRSVEIMTSLGEGVALGDAYKTVQQLAAPLLPSGTQLIPLAEAATLGETSTGIVFIFGFAVIIIMLVLAAQFESFISGIIVMTTIPCGLGCAVFAILMSGISLNIYSQIGLVLLVGIMAKNGILIVEFADQLRDQGRSVREAVEQAANIRLRPVSMTMVCAILGGVPLVLAHGAGAEARVALGWVIVGGLGLATVATLYVTPVSYLLLARFITPKVKEQQRLDAELEQAHRDLKGNL